MTFAHSQSPSSIQAVHIAHNPHKAPPRVPNKQAKYMAPHTATKTMNINSSAKTGNQIPQSIVLRTSLPRSRATVTLIPDPSTTAKATSSTVSTGVPTYAVKAPTKTPTVATPPRPMPVSRAPIVATEFVFADANPAARSVAVVGDWDLWRSAHPLHREEPCIWSVVLQVPCGTCHFRFVEDGRPVLSPRHPVSADSDTNWRTIKPPTPRLPLSTDSSPRQRMSFWQNVLSVLVARRLGNGGGIGGTIPVAAFLDNPNSKRGGGKQEGTSAIMRRARVHAWLIDALLAFGIISDAADTLPMELPEAPPQLGLPGTAQRQKKPFTAWLVDRGYLGVIIVVLITYTVAVVLYIARGDRLESIHAL